MVCTVDHVSMLKHFSRSPKNGKKISPPDVFKGLKPGGMIEMARGILQREGALGFYRSFGLLYARNFSLFYMVWTVQKLRIGEKR